MVIAISLMAGAILCYRWRLDELPIRRRYDMNSLVSRRSVLAIAAVVDVALHSRSAPVAAKSLAARHKLPPPSPGDIAPGPGPRQDPQRRARAARRLRTGARAPAHHRGRDRAHRALSTADPDDLGANSVLLERVIDPAARRAGETFLANLELDHRRTDVRDGRKDACTRRRESQRRFRYLMARPS